MATPKRIRRRLEVNKNHKDECQILTAKPERIPRIAKLMALAIRFEELVESGAVKDFAELARLGMVTRARLTQIMNLRMLAPELQEELLFLHRQSSRDVVSERSLRRIVSVLDWNQQRKAWIGRT